MYNIKPEKDIHNIKYRFKIDTVMFNISYSET